MTSTHLKTLFLTLFLLLAAGLGAAKAYIDHQLHKQLESWKNSVAALVRIDYEEVKTTLTGAVVIKHSQLTSPLFGPVKIDTITIPQAYQFYFHALSRQKESLGNLTIVINIQGLQIPLNDTASPVPMLVKALGYAPYYVSPKELRAWGYPEIRADIDLEAQLNHDNLDFAGAMNAAWGKQVLQVNLKNVPTLATWATSLGQMQLTQLVYSYTDNGLIDKVLTKLAQRNIIPLDNLKQKLIDQIRRDLAQTQIVLEASNLTHLQQFIQQPHTLTVQMQPNPPLAINTLWNASPTRLGLKILSSKTQ